ncbi:MAG: hypothetical protein ACYDB7_01420 [Mycobacteriales bacterium]
MTRLVAVLAVVALVGFDAVSLAVGHVGAVEDAQLAVQAAANAYHTTPTQSAALAAAEAALGSGDESVEPASLRFGAGGQVTLTVRRHVVTLLMADIPGLKTHTFVYATVSASPSPGP